MRRIIFIGLSVLVSVLFLWLALRDVPLDVLIANILQADVRWVLLSMVFTVIGLWTRAIRWRGLLGFRIPVLRAFHIINTMFLMNQIPLRAGEVARSLLATQEGVPLITAATSIVVERLLDTLLVVVMLAVALSQLPDVSAFATNSAALFGVIALMGFAVLIFFARYPQLARNLLAFAERILPLLKRLRLQRLLEHFLDGLQPLTQVRSAAHAIIWTIISWIFSFCTFYCLHRAMNIEGVDLILSSAIALALASFSIAIPVSVMAIGPFEASVVASGQAVVRPALWGAMQATYTALGFVIHGINLLNYAIWGTIGMVTMGVSLGDLLQARKPLPETAAPVAETKTGPGA